MCFCERNEIHEDHIACSLFALMLGWHALWWCVTFPTTSIHSYDQMIRELPYSIYYYDRKAFNKKILELRKAPNESLLQFWKRFENLIFQIREDEIDSKFLKIHTCKNHLNPSNHNLVLVFSNPRHTSLLSQVTLYLLLMKQLYLRSARWEKLWTHLFNCHILPHKLLGIFVQIWLAIIFVFTLNFSLNLHPLIVLFC